MVNWALEIPAPNALAKRLRPERLPDPDHIGEDVTVTAYAAKDALKHAWAGGLTSVDGSTVITLADFPGRAVAVRHGAVRNRPPREVLRHSGLTIGQPEDAELATAAAPRSSFAAAHDWTAEDAELVTVARARTAAASRLGPGRPR